MGIIRRKNTEVSSVFYRHRGGFLSFLDKCNHKCKVSDEGIDSIDINICNISCENKMKCRDFWSRKARYSRSQELNGSLINPQKIKEELNG